MNLPKKVTRSVFVLSSMLLFCNAHADDSLQVGRYLNKEVQTYGGIKAPFSEVAEVGFPSSVETIADAVTWVMKDSGYQLLAFQQSEEEVASILAHALPHDHKSLGPMCREDILKTLVGPGFVLVVDPIHRKLTFKLRGSYARL